MEREGRGGEGRGEEKGSGSRLNWGSLDPPVTAMSLVHLTDIQLRQGQTTQAATGLFQDVTTYNSPVENYATNNHTLERDSYILYTARFSRGRGAPQQI